MYIYIFQSDLVLPRGPTWNSCDAMPFRERALRVTLLSMIMISADFRHARLNMVAYNFYVTKMRSYIYLQILT